MAAHAERIYQPSQFHRTMNCPGWGNMCKNIPQKPGSDYANLGTVAHALGETCLLKNLEPSMFLGKRAWFRTDQSGFTVRFAEKHVNIREEFKPGVGLYETEVDENMVEAVKVYVDEIRRTREAVRHGVFKVEEKLSLEWLVPGMFGTGDHVIVEPLGTLYVHDYKHGQGVAVEVENNSQMMLYGLMAMGEGNPDMIQDVELTIVQPRASHHDGPVRHWKISAEELTAWGETVVKPAIDAALAENAPTVSGKWCKWCDAESQCKTLRAEMLKSADVMFDDAAVPVKSENTSLPDPGVLTDGQLAEVLKLKDLMKSWLSAIEGEGLDRLKRGKKIDGFKLVKGRPGNRKWADEAKVTLAVHNIIDPSDMYETKLLSPAQMEKILKSKGGLKPKEAKEIVDEVSIRPEGANVMAPETDKRPAVLNIDEMFN